MTSHNKANGWFERHCVDKFDTIEGQIGLLWDKLDIIDEKLTTKIIEYEGRITSSEEKIMGLSSRKSLAISTIGAILSIGIAALVSGLV